MNQRLDAVYTKVFFRDNVFLVSMATAAAFALSQWALIALNASVLFKKDQEFINLHYKVFFGVDYYSNWYALFFLPAFGLLAAVINFFLARIAYRTYPRIARLIGIGTGCIELILIASLWLIIQINIF